MGIHRLKDGALAVLNHLAHAVQVGREIDAGGEDALVAFALALAVKLLPPLGQEVQARGEIGENLDFLAILVQDVAGDGIVEHLLVAVLLYFDSASHQCTDIKSGHGDNRPTGVSTEKRPPTLSGMT